MPRFFKRELTKSEKYDQLYEKADKLIKQYNPCQIKDGKCAGGTPCCDGPKCPHLGDSGCRVKALYCKIFICHPLQVKYPKLARQLYKIWEEAGKEGLLKFRASKGETLYPVKW